MHPKPDKFLILVAMVTLLILVGVACPARAEGGNDLHIRGKVKTVVLIGLLHASVTLDAWSTNRLFNNHPPGYRPVEYNPLLKPFAGKPSMYLMANLLTVPTDIFLLKYHRHPRFAEVLVGANIGFEAMMIKRNLQTLDNACHTWAMSQAQARQSPARFAFPGPQGNELQSMRQSAFREMFR